MKKILFIPNYLGGGFGHIGRCAALADELKLRGGTAVFAMNGPHVQSISSAGFEVEIMKKPGVARSGSGGPAYLYIPNMNYQIVRDGFDNAGIVRYALDEAAAIVKKTRPDVIVGDGHPITYLLGKTAGVPVVQLVKSAVHPVPEPLVWWEDQPAGLIQPDPCPIFNPVLKKIGLPEITRAEELLDGDLLLLPSIPELDPMKILPPKTYYTGAIVRRDTGSGDTPDWMQRLDDGRPVIYITIGGAASHSGGNEFFNVMAEAFNDGRYQVVLSTGGKNEPAKTGLPDNIHAVRWVPGIRMITRSSLVIHHGGYTRLEILSHGKPGIVIPFHSEQEYYGRILEKAGVARIVHYSSQPYMRIERKWRGGSSIFGSRKFSVHFRPHMTLSHERVRTTADEILNDQLMSKNVDAMRVKLNSINGPEYAIDMIEKLLS